MLVFVRSQRSVLVQVAVNDVAVGMGVGMEAASPPAGEEADGEHDDDAPDEELGRTLGPPGDELAEEDDRKPEGDEARGMPEPPPEAEDRRPSRRPLFLRGDERRDGHEVVRIRRVAETEHERHGERHCRPAAGETRDRFVETEHAQPEPP
jgi:hypothetical protein